MMTLVHAAWGYAMGRAAYWLLRRRMGRKLNAPLLLVSGSLADVDIFTGAFLEGPFEHHGIFHSLMAAALASAPLVALYRYDVLPYIIAYVQHMAFGDLLANSIPLGLDPAGPTVGLYLLDRNFYLDYLLELAGLAILLALLLTCDLRVLLGLRPRDGLWLLSMVPFEILAVRYVLGPSSLPALHHALYSALALSAVFTYATMTFLALFGLRLRALRLRLSLPRQRWAP